MKKKSQHLFVLIFILLVILTLIMLTIANKNNRTQQNLSPVEPSTYVEQSTIEQSTYVEPSTHVEDEPDKSYDSSFNDLNSSSSSLSKTEPKSIINVEYITVDRTNIKLKVGQIEIPIVTMHPQNAEDKGEKWISSNEKIATVGPIGDIKGISQGTCTITVYSSNNKRASQKISVTVYKPESPTYIKGILVVNKTYSLPSDYNPGVDNAALSAFNKMKKDASASGLKIYISSGFRSYSLQSEIYNNNVKKHGASSTDTFSARPGYSEHQTGLAFDLNSIDSSFTKTKECEWVKQKCHKYGFIIRYPLGKESITGYMYEPWHIRFVGKDIAMDMYQKDVCLEEYFSITSKYPN